MITFATTVLQLALALLMSVQSSSTNITDSMRTQAITVANSAIQIATQALNTNSVTSAPVIQPITSQPQVSTSPVTISSVSPNSGVFDPDSTDKTQDETITISGSGFTSTGNDIVFVKNSTTQTIPNQTGKLEAASLEGGAYGPATYISNVSSNGTSISSLLNNSQSASTGYLFSCAGGGGAGDGWRCTDVSLPVGSYKVYVKNSNGDVSNGLPFTVTSATVSNITVISPNGGENWQIGVPHQISFQSNYPVNIFLSSQNNLNGSYSTIATNVSSPYIWTGNITAPSSSGPAKPGNYYICISNGDTGQSACSSNTFFISYSLSNQ